MHVLIDTEEALRVCVTDQHTQSIIKEARHGIGVPFALLKDSDNLVVPSVL